MNKLAIAVLLSPYFFVWLLVPQLEYDFEAGWLIPLYSGFKQAFLSSVASLALGFLLSLSLFSCGSEKQIQKMRVILLAPNFIPPLFIILSLMSFTQIFELSHQGLFWVVVLHSLINAGLFAVAFHSHYLLNLRSRFEVAKVLGAGRFLRILKVGVPLTFSILVQNFFLIFAICLVSFSIPFVLSGGGVTSLEVHIFRLIKSEGKWGLGLVYSLIQTFVVLGLGSLFWATGGMRSMETKAEIREAFLARHFQLIGWLPIVFLSFYWLKDLVEFVSSVTFEASVLRLLQSPTLIVAVLNSSLLFLMVFFLQILFCMIVTCGPISPVLERFFRGYLAPSVAVLGFALSLLPGEGEFMNLFKTSLCFSFLTFPLLFRWQVLERWKGLTTQIHVARVLGASTSETFWSVIWPQLKSVCLMLALMASVWSLGDFAVSSFFLAGDQTLALMALELLNKYQLELASFLSFVIFCVGTLIFYAAQRTLSYVTD